MSRTDKDRPYWVRLNDSSENRVADHTHHPYGGWWNPGGRWFAEEYVCDIDKPMTGHYEIDRKRNCDYRLANYRWYDEPTKRDRREEYYAPLRHEERDTLDKAVKQYNATGEVDDIYLPESHRHAPFRGGYWN